MADQKATKVFIGRVLEISYPDGNKAYSLSLNETDLKLLVGKKEFLIQVKKSKKGSWYAELQ
jgi:hypothetical protein